MQSASLSVSLSGPDNYALFHRLLELRFAGGSTLSSLLVDDRPLADPHADIAAYAASCRRSVFAQWSGQSGGFISYDKDLIVKAGFIAAPDQSAISRWMWPLPVELSSFDALYEQWRDRPDFPGPSFGDLHYALGWACAFKGAGHNRLVSRRWLDFGPWVQTKFDNDVSFIQFHDPSATADTAWEQARPGHLRMGIAPEGGFIQTGYVYEHGIDGNYNASERRLKILVHGRTVTEREMLDACAVRHYQALGRDRPLNSIAYIFASEEQARNHLHELWLRELECWAIVDGHEVRLDGTYRPLPKKPSWVQQLGH